MFNTKRNRQGDSLPDGDDGAKPLIRHGMKFLARFET